MVEHQSARARVSSKVNSSLDTWSHHPLNNLNRCYFQPVIWNKEKYCVRGIISSQWQTRCQCPVQLKFSVNQTVSVATHSIQIAIHQQQFAFEMPGKLLTSQLNICSRRHSNSCVHTTLTWIAKRQFFVPKILFDEVML